MQPYQIKYIENVRRIRELNDFFAVPATDFPSWYEARSSARREALQLRAENDRLLTENLFPTLAELTGASEDTIADLTAFAAELMDWSTNLDTGVYVLIHDAFLRIARLQKDRNAIIRELYLLGMGLYYQNRPLTGIGSRDAQSFSVEDELLFTEGGSYLKYFPEIDSEEIKGYIIRSLANISIATLDRRKKIAVTARVLSIIQDPYYRELAPELPWDVYLRRAHQQMSACRTSLSRGNLRTDELAAVFESCAYVFKPEEHQNNPNIRWLWPYYEMEYSCGFASLEQTFDRMEAIMRQADPTEYNESGLYGCVQLPIYYGRLLSKNPSIIGREHKIQFLCAMYDRMIQMLLSYPTELIDEQFRYIVTLVITDYYEIPEVRPYRELTTELMQRFTGSLFIRSRKTGKLLQHYCDTILAADPGFFDDIPFLREAEDPGRKRELLMDYAGSCGLYFDFGLVKMNMERLFDSRSLFDREARIRELHCMCGYEDLKHRPSTEVFADIALGHHRWYNGADGYPASYVRATSPYRQMTDVVAVCAYLVNTGDEDPDRRIDAVLAGAHRQFSPLVTSYLEDDLFRKQVKGLLLESDSPYYQEIYQTIRK